MAEKVRVAFQNTPFAAKYLWRPLRYSSLHAKRAVFDLKTIMYHHILRKRSLARNGPGLLIIVPSTICTSKCVFCAYRLLKDQGQVMPFETAKKAIDDFAQMGGNSVSFTPTVGEALVDPNVFEKIKYAKEKGMSTFLYTNGTRLPHDGNIDKILDSGLDALTISIGDVRPEIDSQIFGTILPVSEGKIKGILELLRKKAERKSTMTVTLAFRCKRKFKEILSDIESSEWREYYNQGIFQIEFTYGYDNWGGRVRQEDLLGMQRLRSAPRLRKYPCRNLLQLSVLPNGDVRLCGCRVKSTLYDDLIVGNINKQPLKEIAESEQVQKIHDGFAKGEVPDVCKNCSFYNI
jgi:radical SAM protein with 4Fe4S-binding SPASM domain